MSDFSIDITPYVDLTVFDRDAVSIVEMALQAALTRLPDWKPNEGNTETVLIEAFAVEVVELIYAANRAPRKITEVLLRLFSLTPDVGAPSTADLNFTVSDTLGHVVPAGTRVRLELGAGVMPLDFLTDSDLTIDAGFLVGTVASTAVESGIRSEDTPSGTALALVDAVFFVDDVELDTVPTGGRDPETADAFLTRGVAKLARLVTTLVLPEHFQLYAVDEGGMGRAFAIDNYDPSLHNEIQRLTITGTPTGGGVQLTVPGVTGGGPTATIPHNATADDVQDALELLAGIVAGDVHASGGPWPGTPIDIEFRRAFAAQNIATITTSSTLSGGVGPAIGVTTVQAGNTTGGGGDAGYVTVAVLSSSGADVSDAEKAVIAGEMDALAQANLSISVVDPTVSLVAVVATVQSAAGYDPAVVQASIETALTEYMDPLTWPWDSLVRRNDLIALIEGIDGVEYLVAGDPATPAADVVLPGIAPLAQFDLAGSTITVT